MKKLIFIFLISCMLGSSLQSDPLKTISPDVVALMNSQLPKPDHVELKTGDWVWLTTWVVIGSIFMAISYKDKEPIHGF